MIRLADYVIDFLVKRGINDIFLVSGGGIMYLLDAVGRNKKIHYITNFHEQACATAAESYARFKNRPGACLVTSGPGSTNAVTGVAAAWVDSIPMIVISGQIRKQIIADYSTMRQFGPQEINTIDIVDRITKYSKTIMSPEDIRHELERAYFEATTGRPGPVWLNIPLDVQGSMINENNLKSFSPPQNNYKDKIDLKKKVKKAIAMLNSSERPILIAGNGIRLSGGQKLLKEFMNRIKIPVITDENGLDLLAENNKYYMGRYGPKGQRRANFALQNADILLSIGASLNVASTGFVFTGFASKAKKIKVNIDQGELHERVIKLDLSIKSDAKEFMKELLKQSKQIKFHFSPRWYEALKKWKKKYQLMLLEYYKDKHHVNSYVFVARLSSLLKSSDTVIPGMGLDVVSVLQVYKVKENQRVYSNKNFGQMGWCLPAAIGACVANDRKRTISVTGDGSLQFNIHELGTISHYKLPIKIFVFNNHGYKSIRDTQTNLFEGRFVGADEKSGVSNPDFRILAKAYRLKYEYIKNNSDIKRGILSALKSKGPALIEVNIAYDQERMPRTLTYRKPTGVLKSRPLEDMYPFLPREELWDNMHMFDIKIKKS